MGRPIDSQRQKLYNAQNESIKKIEQPKFDTIDEVRAYVEKIMNSPWWKKRYPDIYRLEIENGAGKTAAKGGPIRNGLWMTLPRWARKPCTILHEMAHGIVPRDVAAHGREYAGVLVELVTRFMGKEAGKQLRASFAKHKVKYKSKRTLSPEQKALAIARIKSFQKIKNTSLAANKREPEGLE